MTVMYVLIALGLLMAAAATAAFVWAVKTGQFDDERYPAQRIVFDDLDLEQRKRRGM